MKYTKEFADKIIEAHKKNFGMVTITCKQMGISRITFYEWIKKYPDFAEQINEAQDVAIDFAESMLMKNIQAQDTTSIIFYLKTIGKRRGYVEKALMDVTSNGESIIPKVIEVEVIENKDQIKEKG